MFIKIIHISKQCTLDCSCIRIITRACGARVFVACRVYPFQLECIGVLVRDCLLSRWSVMHKLAALHLRALLVSIGIYQETPVTIYEDNQAAQKIAENPVLHDRTRHIDIRYHFVRDILENWLNKINEDIDYLHNDQTDGSRFTY